jgi:putative phosphonate metabolism protein
MFDRYAIYFTPQPGPLADFGAQWLGWDLVTGAEVAHPQVDGIDVAALTQTPRKYGFHGTMKAPFRLAPGTTLADLTKATAQFCASRPAFDLTGLRLASLGRFLALIPDGDAGPLNDLAGAAVTTLDPFRAPLTEADLQRRRASGLSPAEDAYLVQWGYPYVLDLFQFHMTLSGSLDPETLAQTQQALRPLLDPILPRPFRIDSLTLCGEDASGRFHQIERFGLGG